MPMYVAPSVVLRTAKRGHECFLAMRTFMHRFNLVVENSSFFFMYIRVSSRIEFLANRMYADHAQHPENTLHPGLGHR